MAKTGIADTSSMTFGQKVKMFVNNNQAGVALILAALLYIITIICNPGSLNKTAFGNIILLTILLAIPAAGCTIVLIGGGLDFCVGAVMSATAVVTAQTMMGQNGHFIQTLALALLVGLLVGLANGITIVATGLPPMIVSMAICNVLTRLMYVFTGGSFAGQPSPALMQTVTARYLFGFVPNIVIYAVILFPLIFFILKFSRFGKQLYLIGNNETAARLTGVKVEKVKIISYIISGLLAAFAGVIGEAYIYGARMQAFDDYGYKALLAVIVGGTSFDGGVGSFEQTICGCLLMVLLSNWITTMQFSVPVQYIVNGAVLVALMALYNRSGAVRQ